MGDVQCGVGLLQAPEQPRHSPFSLQPTSHYVEINSYLLRKKPGLVISDYNEIDFGGSQDDSSIGNKRGEKGEGI